MSGWPDRCFLDLVGSEQPIVQAPMANGGGVELCVAALRGGAVGSLPGGMVAPDELRAQVGAVRERAQGPINLNFFCHRPPPAVDDSAWRALLKPYYEQFSIESAAPGPARMPFGEAACAVVEEVRPALVSFHFGLPEQALLDRVKAAGTVVVASATSVEEALWLERAGVDAVIAQGIEAGGHSGRFLGADPAEAMTLFALLPQVVDAVAVPVIAAGGIGDGRGIAAAFLLGASAAQIGTAYLHCPESLLAPEQRHMLKERPTLFTNLYSGGLARAVRGRLVDELGAVRSEAPSYPLAGAAAMPLWRAAQQQRDFGFMPSLAGQSAPLGQALPAADLTRKLAEDALALLGRPA
ncbi:MAG: nitronate monooxygenase [Sphingomonas sp.]|uniref:NAD(P)H-dependent flavin oxidoreductase n=1 Tax=Sphingomonas sp. TaxID=28214 RepID=UPI0018187EAB|nr:nitronate monooxygenase [Sphingomonas sp.]MBA3666871.1 nitronate monooxygenase [Sphingomonas sp.]